MKATTRLGTRLFACAAGAILAACSSSGTGGFAPAPADGWVSTNATGSGLVYWGDYNNSVVTIFPSKGINPKPIGQITNGISSPERLWVDRNGNLYVTNIGNGTITEYAPGGTSPILTISNGVNRPTGLVVGSNGTVYCANVGNNTVTVYPKGQVSPSLTISISNRPEYLAVDKSNNLYVSYLGTGSNPPNGVLKFPPNSTNGKDLGLNIGASGLDAIVLDRLGNIILTNDAASYIYIFPAGQTQPSAKIPVSGTPYDLSLNKLENKLYVAVEESSGFVVQTLAYPSGTILKNKITTSDGQWLLAVSPDAVL